MLIENNDSFLSELTRMFNLNRTENGPSLYITLKMFEDKDEKKIVPSLKYKKKKPIKKPIQKTETINPKIKDNKCLIRAKIGKKKISTIIYAKDFNKFQSAYSSLLRGNFYGLKDKKKNIERKEQK